ncbi:hypothetical protein [Mucilaginibacter xinganensis]|uniref:hypothetical protein n=1 Tax=Mucilaginibacter xinganensis TaxID=1234841 RepID=UPI000B994C77|nr:hypothetical protein [Mucilaginibacter xinganensis]
MKSTSFNLGDCIIDGKKATDVTVTITHQFEIGNKVTAISSKIKCTGFITKIDDDSIWLNEIRFPRDICSFLPA